MLEFVMKVDFTGGRWFQVKAIDDGGVKKLEIKTNPNTLLVTPAEQVRITLAIQTAVEAIDRFTQEN